MITVRQYQGIESLPEAGGVTVFASNREISPFNPTARRELHNQTMTITIWVEQ